MGLMSVANMKKALCLSQNEIDIIIPDARQDAETHQKACEKHLERNSGLL